MKFNKLAALLLASGFASVTFAAGQGSGQIDFVGEIIDAPCSLEHDSAFQTIKMGQVSNKELNKGKTSSTMNPINIALKDCSIDTLKTVKIQFRGANDSNKDLLAINGSAKGAGIRLTNVANELVVLGTDEPAQVLVEGNGNVLRFNAQLQGSDAAGEVTPGNFTAVADFALTYQ